MAKRNDPLIEYAAHLRELADAMAKVGHAIADVHEHLAALVPEESPRHGPDAMTIGLIRSALPAVLPKSVMRKLRRGKRTKRVKGKS